MSKWSYLSAISDQPLLGATIGDYFDEVVERWPDREALVARQQGVHWSYAQLAEQVDRWARGLLALGIAKGDRVGIWAPNRSEWLVTQLATAKIGAILVNVNPAYRASELEYAARQSDLRVLVFAERVRRTELLEILQEIMPELALHPVRPERVRAVALPELEHLITLAADAPRGAWCWADVAGLAERVTPSRLWERQHEQQFDDPINIQYTSGTTGSPKGATLSHHNILNNAYFVAERMRLTHEDRLCIPVPLYHCFGMVLGNLACITHGAAMVYPAETFDAGATLEAVQEERCTALHGVPTMFITELSHPEFDRFDLRSLRTGIAAGAPCPIEVMREIQERMHMREVEIAYGMTETSPVSCQTLADDPVEKRVGTVGTILPHLECKVIDPATGALLPEGTPGELCTRGYAVMLGYWNDPDATASAVDRAGWMHTGDLATIQEGYVQIVGRLKDLIIRGGENIYPREIEELLHTHPEVADVYVIGVPCPKYGEQVMAWVKLQPNSAAGEKELRDFCRERMAHFKTPRYVKLVDSFPMTVTGKVQKFVMRRIAVEELGLEGS
jgi:fatty-acyl-CoA synthase